MPGPQNKSMDSAQGGALDLWRFSTEMALRYSWSRSGAMSSVSLAAVAGLALSICVLIVVVSVVNGFERELKTRVLSVVPHISVYRRGGMTPHPQAPSVLAEQPQISGVAAYVQQAALITSGEHVIGAVVNGVDPQHYRSVSSVFDFLTHGSLDGVVSRGYTVVVGSRVARQLNVEVGDSLSIVLPVATVSPVGLIPRQRRFEVAAIVDTQSDNDARSVYVHIADAQRLFRMGGKISGYQLRLHDLFDIEGAYEAVDAAFLEGGMLVRAWTRVHGPLLQAILTQKLTMFVLLSFLVAVAAFNLISGLVMVVDQRSADVAVLRTLGSRTPKIVGVFVTVGLMLGVLAIALGVGVGVLISWALPGLYASLSAAFEADLMTQYFIGYLPVDVRFTDVFAIVVVSILLTALATLFPAWRATRLRPAQVLAHE